MKKLLAAFLLLLCTAASTYAVEDAKVASGITATDYLVDGTGTTNIEYTIPLTSAFTTTNGSATVTVAHNAHGYSNGQAVVFSDTSTTVGGLVMDGAWTIATHTANAYTFTHTGTASGNAGPTGSTNETATSAGQDGKMRFLCFFSHMNYDDPIKNPGQQGAAHLHTFFGNTLTDYLSTYVSLRTTGMSTCDGGPINRTGYWFPSMIDSLRAKALYPEYFEWYYADARSDLVDTTSPNCVSRGGDGFLQDGRAIACPNLAIKKIERGQKAIFGIDMATGDYPTSYVGPFAHINGSTEDGFATLAGIWTCQDTGGVQQGVSYRYLSHSVTPSLGLTSNASCPSSGKVVARVSSPSCWDGNHDSADHLSHFATAGRDGFGGLTYCPTTHPHRFTQFTVIVSWNYTGGISTINNWYLSSDRHHGAVHQPGFTWHWDMMWAWEDGAGQDVLSHFAKWLQGMNPNPEAGAPYIYDSKGANWVGGKFMRNTNNGGQGPDCSDIGYVGNCMLKQHQTLGVGISDVAIDIPAMPVTPPTKHFHKPHLR